jgi:hypothetical protein
MNTLTTKQKNQLRTAWESLQAAHGRLRRIEKAFIKASRAVGEWLELPNLSLLSPEDAVDAATAAAEQESACDAYAGASHRAEPTEQLLAWYLARYRAFRQVEKAVEQYQISFENVCREAGLDKDSAEIEKQLRAEYRNRVLEDAKES